MTRPSTRYAVPIAALATLALIPVVIHGYLGLRVEDCADPAALLPEGNERREYELPSPHGVRRVRHWVGRSYDPKQVYYRPAVRVMHEVRPVAERVEWLEADGEALPIHRVIYGDTAQASRDLSETRVVAAYLLVYRGEPVANPYLAQLGAAPALLLRGRLPMTLFFTGAFVPAEDVEWAEEQSREWLISSWRAYRTACPP